MLRRFVLGFGTVVVAVACSGGAWDDGLTEDVGVTESMLRKDMGGTNGDADYCVGTIKCASGEGDCDSNGQCQSGLVCAMDDGPRFGMPNNYDVCVPPHCTDGIQTPSTDETDVDCGASGSDCGECFGCPPDSANGGVSFCSTLCPCTSGQGDCDSNSECGTGVVCADNNGAQFGMPQDYDVCVPAHCTDGVQTGSTDETGVDCGASGSDCGACIVCPDDSLNGGDDFCNGLCPCSSGQGDCDNNTQCEAGLVCAVDNGVKFGMPAMNETCVPPHCVDGVQTGGTDETGIDCGAAGSDCGECVACPDDSLNGGNDFCTGLCPCSSGQGDCDNNTQCEAGLVCAVDNGVKFGMPAMNETCVPPHCVDGVQTGGTDETGVDCGAIGSDCGECQTCAAFDPSNPNPNFCTANCKCGEGEGDCDRNSECQTGLVCVTNMGRPFGLPSSYEVCLAPLAFSSISPVSGYYPGNMDVAIHGAGFTGTESVTIGGAACTDVSFVSTSEIHCFTPPGAVGAVDVVVTRGASSVTGANAFSYVGFTRVDTIAGTTAAGSTDGTGDLAQLSGSINALDVVGSNLYVADGLNYKVRKIDLSSLDPSNVLASDVTVSTLAGSGTMGTADSSDGTGATAQFQQPDALSFITGNFLYVSDTDWVNFPAGASTIRQVNPTSGETLTVVGGEDGYAGLADWGGYVYVAECGSDNTIKRWQVGTSNVIDFVGTPGTYGDVDGVGAAARFNCPYGLTVDPTGQYLYFTDWANQKLKQVEIATQTVTTIAGTGAQGHTDGAVGSAMFDAPNKVSAGENHIFIGEMDNCDVREVNLGTAQVSTVAGIAKTCGVVDGPLGSATFAGVVAVYYAPSYGVFVGSGNWGWRKNSVGYRVRLIH